MFWTLYFVIWAVSASSSGAMTVVKTRAYQGRDLGVARQYHAQYFSYVRNGKHIPHDHWSPIYPCGNFEANSEGKYMGFFRCRQPFEPYGFDYCCGVQSSHYCCPNASLATPFEHNPAGMPPEPEDYDPDKSLKGVWIGLGIFFAIVIAIVAVLVYVIKCRRPVQRRRRRGSTTQANMNLEAVKTIDNIRRLSTSASSTSPTGPLVALQQRMHHALRG